MTLHTRDEAVLEEALTRMTSAGPELTNGMSNHAPMAVEALCVLGRGDAALPWLDGYAAGFMPRPSATRPILEASWRDAAGDPRRVPDWFAFFNEALENAPWQTVLDRWVERLAPGIVAAAMHGVIRTGHAVRALSRSATRERRRELADGLAYWAAEYQPLPGTSRPAAAARPSAAIERVAVIPPAERRPSASLSGALLQLAEFPPFADALSAVDPSGDASAFLSDLTATFARATLAHGRDWLTAIAFVHTVTGPSALRPMLPHLRPETARTALAYVWQASAGLYASYASPGAARVDDAPAPPIAELVARAVDSDDEHAIKFTEVCLREHAVSPQPEFLAAAAHATRMLATGP